VFAVHGSATTAMQAILDNLIEPGDKVLVGISGRWGQVMADISTRLGKCVFHVVFRDDQYYPTYLL